MPRWAEAISRRLLPAAALAGLTGAALAGPPIAGTVPREGRLDPYEAYEAGAFETAAALFAEQVRRAPDEGSGHLNLGAALYKAGQLESAERSFRGALAAEPASTALAARAWYNRGNAAYRQGRLEEAIAAYEETLRRAPGDQDAQHNLALARRRLAAFPPPPPPPGEGEPTPGEPPRSGPAEGAPAQSPPQPPGPPRTAPSGPEPLSLEQAERLLDVVEEQRPGPERTGRPAPPMGSEKDW